jgi:putative SOS response-associated peptidase YedK
MGNLALARRRENSRSFTIITTQPNTLCAELHNRMPAVLKPEAWPLWLGERPADVPQLKALLASYPSEDMISWPVSARVGNVKNNDPSRRNDRVPLPTSG